MDDTQIHAHIEELVAEEHRLMERAGHEGGLQDPERERLATIKVELDRYWDLLRQRKALEEFGLDPDAARIRSADTVEHYRQ
jgi:hypothetical protein